MNIKKQLPELKAIMMTSLFWILLIMSVLLLYQTQRINSLTKANQNYEKNIEELTKQYGQKRIILDIEE